MGVKELDDNSCHVFLNWLILCSDIRYLLLNVDGMEFPCKWAFVIDQHGQDTFKDEQANMTLTEGRKEISIK